MNLTKFADSTPYTHPQNPSPIHPWCPTYPTSRTPTPIPPAPSPSPPPPPKSAIKLANEPPTDVKSNLRAAYSLFNEETLARSSRPVLPPPPPPHPYPPL